MKLSGQCFSALCEALRMMLGGSWEASGSGRPVSWLRRVKIQFRPLADFSCLGLRLPRVH
jgi:hypothetical protein